MSASEADPDLGFMARLLALCSLPRTNPGNQHQYKRVNGPFTLYMTASGGNKLPYGKLPRLILAWVCSEAVRTQSRELVLGKSLSRVHADPRRLQQQRGKAHPAPQSNEAAVWLHCLDDLRERTRGSPRQFTSGRPHRFFGGARASLMNPRCGIARSSWARSSFNEIINHPVPLNMSTLMALKRSTLGLDLYLWLVYRTFPLRAPLPLVRLLRCATALRVTAPLGYGSRRLV